MFSELLHNFSVVIQLERTYFCNTVTVVVRKRWVDQCPRCEPEAAGPTHSWTGRKESGGPVPGRASENPSSLSAQKRRAGGLRGWSVGVGFCLNFSRVLEVRPPGHYRPAGPRGPRQHAKTHNGKAPPSLQTYSDSSSWTERNLKISSIPRRR